MFFVVSIVSDSAYFKEIVEIVLSDNCIFSILVRVSVPSSINSSDGEE